MSVGNLQPRLSKAITEKQICLNTASLEMEITQNGRNQVQVLCVISLNLKLVPTGC